MHRHGVRVNRVSILSALVVCFLLFLLAGRPAMAVGPNLMVNSGFEGGNQQYIIQSAFSIVRNPAEAHAGSRMLQATLNRTYTHAYQTLACWKGTRYTSRIWYRGVGSLTFEIMGSDWNTVLAGKTLTASSSWQRADIAWNSNGFTSVMVMLYDSAGVGTMYFDDFYTGLTDGATMSFDARNPAASTPKFKLLFDDEFAGINTIDTNNTGADGYKWYPQSFYGSQFNSTSNMYAVSRGSLTFMDSGNPFGEVLHTARPSHNKLGYIGTVFSGGKGLYAVARIAMLNVGSIGSKGWPAFWSNDMKGETGLNETMPGCPEHKESIENDYMEYNPTWGSTGDWYSTMHDWCDTNLGNANSVITAPVGTDFTQAHTYGMLWVPATAANRWHGYRQAYFDGEPQQAVCWIGNQNYSAGVFPETEASMGSYQYSLMDRDRFEIILGSSQGGIPTMRVSYVRVYAVDSSSVTVVPSSPPP